MENFIKRNLKWITIIFICLFFFKSFQSCTRKTSIRIVEKKLTTEYDSIIVERNLIIDSLKKENLTKEFIIKDLSAELKIAGVKVNEAERRADAVQKTASAVRSHTTIEVKGVERDSLNKIK